MYVKCSKHKANIIQSAFIGRQQRSWSRLLSGRWRCTKHLPRRENAGPGGSDAVLSEIKITAPVGIKESAITDSGLSLFPNPANAIISVITDKVIISPTIKITNVLGQVVYLQTVEGIQNTFSNINISNLDNGVYFISISNDKYKSVSKFVKQWN